MTPTQPISSTHFRTCVQISNSCKIDIIVLHTSFYQRNKLDRSLWQYICWLLAHFYEKPFRPGSNLNQWPKSVRSHVSCSNISVLSPNSWNKVQVSQNQWIPQSVRLIIPFPTFNEKHKDDTCVNTRCPQFFKKTKSIKNFLSVDVTRFTLCRHSLFGRFLGWWRANYSRARIAFVHLKSIHFVCTPVPFQKFSIQNARHFPWKFHWIPRSVNSN